MNLKQIIKYVKNYILEIEKSYCNIIDIEVSANEENFYWVIFTLQNCIAEIVISKNYFSPYKDIMFQALSFLNDSPKPIYTWYNKDNIDELKLKVNLDNAIKFIINYK